MTVLAIDPGTDMSGVYAGPGLHGVLPNKELLRILECNEYGVDCIAIEMVASYGMPVGREVFETCVWIGRFMQAWNASCRLVYRKDVKMTLCGNPRAKDSNIRQALMDIYGAPGTAKAKGGTYGVKSHAWAALAVWHHVTVSPAPP
jgi:hypothetical protein